MKTKLLCLILLILTVSSCKKEEKINDPISLLTSKPWKPSRHYTFMWLPYDYDDTYKFGINQLIIDKGAVKSPYTSPQNPQIETQTETVDYQIDLTNKTLSLDGITYEIIELSENQLQLGYGLPHSSGYTQLIRGFEH
jgi:hypothetical protein